MAVRQQRERYPVGWQMGKPNPLNDTGEISVSGKDLNLKSKEDEEKELPRRKDIIRVTITHQGMPDSLRRKNEAGDLVIKKDANRAIYDIADILAEKLKFLPLYSVNIRICRYSLNGIPDMGAFLEVCLRILHRAGVIEHTTGPYVRSVTIDYVKTDRKKVVILVEPIKNKGEEDEEDEEEKEEDE